MKEVVYELSVDIENKSSQEDRQVTWLCVKHHMEIHKLIKEE